MEREVILNRWRGAVLTAGLVVFLAADLCRAGGETRSSPASNVEWRAEDRVLVLAPHPGDEVLGCGATLRRAVSRGVPVRVAFLTCGEHSQWSLHLYRERMIVMPDDVSHLGPQRLREARAAAGRLGLGPDDVVFLGYPDFGTLNIWLAHWAEALPFRSMLTRTRQVPCAEALHPDAPYKGEVLLDDLKAVIRAFRPTRVCVSHPADHHPDHQALYLFTRVALWDLAGDREPEILPYLIHYTKWPVGGHNVGRWLTPPPDLVSPITWRGVVLDGADATARNLTLKEYRTDQSSARRLRQFARQNDLFGDFPDVPLNAESVLLDNRSEASRLPDGLTREEQDRFVGIRTRAAQLDGDALRMDIQLTGPLERGVGASVYVFGYRPDQSFERMPKLHICLNAFSYEVLDQERKWPTGVIVVKRSGSELHLRIPLKALGFPERILTGARTYLNEIPLDWAAWRVLNVTDSPSASVSSSDAE